MTAILPISVSADTSGAWRRALNSLAVLTGIVLALFHSETFEIISIWWNSSTFNHCLLILPILGWLVWQRRGELSRLEPSPWWPGLLWIAAGGLAWLLGYGAGVNLLRHAGLIIILQGLVVSCLGKTLSRGLLFPLFYSLFLIPAGAEIVPQMQLVTAEICMALLNLSGIPAHLDGIFISTSVALFEVAEACAGVRFLVAMLAFGVLAAHLCFRSWKRRAAFVAACVIVPVLANGFRAWGTIYLAFRTSVEQAVGLDHIIYGGVFFAIVMALIVGGAWPFFDRRPDEPPISAERLLSTGEKPSGRAFVPLVIVALATAIAPPGWTAAIARTSDAAPVALQLPHVAGWQRVADPGTRPWRPTYEGADAVQLGHYRDGSGAVVDLAIVYFARQDDGGELLSAGQGAAGPGWAWSGDAPSPPNGRAERIVGEEVVREALTFYRIGGKVTGSGLDVRLETMRARLLGGSQSAAAIIVSAQAPVAGASSRASIDRFLAALGPIGTVADRAGAR